MFYIGSQHSMHVGAHTVSWRYITPQNVQGSVHSIFNPRIQYKYTYIHYNTIHVGSTAITLLHCLRSVRPAGQVNYV